MTKSHQAMLQPMIEEAMGNGGTRAATEAFWAFVAGESIRPLPEAVIDRMLGNGCRLPRYLHS